jgi:L-rhamnose mutarotase
MRIGFVMAVNEGAEVEYERRHRELWPELEEELRSNGVREYSIYLHPETRQLFAYVNLDDENGWDDLADSPTVQRWYEYMREMMPTNADGSPVMTPLQEVFRLD